MTKYHLLLLYISPLHFIAAVAITHSPHNRSVTTGTKVTLQCQAIAVPSPTIRWYKNGERVANTTYYEDDKQVFGVTSHFVK